MDVKGCHYNVSVTGETYTIMRNGRMYIVKPDGSVHNLSGAKIM